MLAALFLKLTRYAWFRRLVWKPIYNWLAKDFKAEKWYFMNYGYVPGAGEALLELKDEDEINRYQIQLYHYLAVKTEIRGKEILEVGSGRGGGARYIATYLDPKFMTGMDLAPSATRLSNQLHKAANLNYINGNAESIPLKDAALDVVINVESCHAYGSVPKFLSEVKRVLRPGGTLVLTDLRSPEGMKLLEQHLHNCGLEFLEEDEISVRVVEAIELEEDVKRARIKQAIPKWLHEAFAEFGGAVGSQIHLQLKSGELVYKRFVLRK